MVEDTLRDLDGGHGVPPSGVEREMRDDLRDLTRADTVVQSEGEIVRLLGGLIPRNQGRDRDDAAVAGRELWALPQARLQRLPPVALESG